MVQELERSGPRQKFYDTRLIKGVLESPTAVYQDLQREGYSEAYCYCGLPPSRFRTSEIEIPPPPGRVFLVFVAVGVRGNIVLDWEWRAAHNDKLGHLMDDSCFGRQLWPMTS
jgi:hypothetical protein